MLISELAQKVGLHPETIRRLEKRGVITAARRDLNGWRHYSPEVLDKLKILYAREGSTVTAPKDRGRQSDSLA